MGSYPQDFPVPVDQGGPGQGKLVGGFGGDPSADQSAHRVAVQRAGKVPVLLIHGNAGAADLTEWDMLDLKRMLNDAGYPEELLWAPSYLGPGIFDDQALNPKPHTNNVTEVREFIDRVCEYLNVDVVDICAHSLGCSLVYAICRGLEKREPPPVNFNQPKKWHRVGTFVALAGAFHGLGANASGEWKPGGEFMRALLEENLGGGGETPYGPGKPQTPAPAPHNITYFCGIAQGDFIDAQHPGTGRLAGAINVEYPLGPSSIGHKAIKENTQVFRDFLPHLNAVPPAPLVAITIDPATGSYDTPLTISLTVAPPDKSVDFAASRVTKAFWNGLISVTVLEALNGTLRNGQALTLSTDGMWELVFSAEGPIADIRRTYWVGIEAVDVTIVTDNSVPFQGSLVVMATTGSASAKLYHSLGSDMWNEGANVAITENAVVSFIAVTPAGIASEVVSRSFKRLPAGDQVTANVNEHFIARRIDVNEFLSYLGQFGLAPFTLYLVNGDWVLDPNQPIASRLAAAPAASHDSGTFREPVTLSLSAGDEADPNAKIYYTTDGSEPTTSSPFFAGSGQIRLDSSGTKIVKYRAQTAAGNLTDVETKTYEMEVADVRPVIKVREGDPQPGEYGGALAITIEAVDDKDDHVTVFYTRDGSLPDERSPSFQDRELFEPSGTGNHAIVCYAQDSDGNETYETFAYAISA
jgi:pimeloyl-ACP methyl ester carboxylesterase